MNISLINTSNFRIDGGAMFGVVPKVLWNRAYPQMGDNLIPLAIRSLVVETNGRIIVIDTGIGSKQDERSLRFLSPFGGQELTEALAGVGYSPNQVTDVIHTHLHFDHCGGSVRLGPDGQPELTFPNAQYHVGKDQWETAVNPNPREADSFLPENIHPMKELGALNPIENDLILTPGVELRLYHGHTKGQIVPLIRTPKGCTLVFAADLVPTAAHIPLVWNMSYDVEPLVTMHEKQLLLEEALRGDYTLVYQHDYYTECSTLTSTSKGIRAGRKMRLDEVL